MLTFVRLLQKFSVKLSDGVVANSYKPGKRQLTSRVSTILRAEIGDKFYIGCDKLLPMERFTQPNSTR